MFFLITTSAVIVWRCGSQLLTNAFLKDETVSNTRRNILLGRIPYKNAVTDTVYDCKI